MARAHLKEGNELCHEVRAISRGHGKEHRWYLLSTYYALTVLGTGEAEAIETDVLPAFVTRG